MGPFYMHAEQFENLILNAAVLVGERRGHAAFVLGVSDSRVRQCATGVTGDQMR